MSATHTATRGTRLGAAGVMIVERVVCALFRGAQAAVALLHSTAAEAYCKAGDHGRFIFSCFLLNIVCILFAAMAAAQTPLEALAPLRYNDTQTAVFKKLCACVSFGAGRWQGGGASAAVLMFPLRASSLGIKKCTPRRCLSPLILPCIQYKKRPHV